MLRLGMAAAAVASALSAPVLAARPHFIDAKLVTASSHPAPGSTILVGLEMNPHPGWHGYWSNPGESGLAPVVTWRAPPGVHFGGLQHPAPTLLRVMGMTSFVHAGPHVLLARMSLDRKLPKGTVLPVTAEVTWAACSDRLCVPERARLSLRMQVGDGSPSADASLLARARSRVPKQLAPGSFSVRKGKIVLQLPSSARLQRSRTRFFPDQNGYWNSAKAVAMQDIPLRIVSPAEGKPPGRISGVASDGTAAYRVTFERKETRR